jgi:hypothetical protein
MSSSTPRIRRVIDDPEAGLRDRHPTIALLKSLGLLDWDGHLAGDKLEGYEHGGRASMHEEDTYKCVFERLWLHLPLLLFPGSLGGFCDLAGFGLVLLVA